MRSVSPAGQVMVRSRTLLLRAAYVKRPLLLGTQGRHTISPPRPRTSWTSAAFT
jgi:hypothetical protein